MKAITLTADQVAAFVDIYLSAKVSYGADPITKPDTFAPDDRAVDDAIVRNAGQFTAETIQAITRQAANDFQYESENN